MLATLTLTASFHKTYQVFGAKQSWILGSLNTPQEASLAPLSSPPVSETSPSLPYSSVATNSKQVAQSQVQSGKKQSQSLSDCAGDCSIPIPAQNHPGIGVTSACDFTVFNSSNDCDVGEALKSVSISKANCLSLWAHAIANSSSASANLLLSKPGRSAFVNSACCSKVTPTLFCLQKRIFNL